jgi:selenocysteine-specific elongation factor
VIIGTAGHIDHGKTSLIRALTGIDTDRLPEEKARGITLDLGFAYIEDGRLGFVDVPGHERLVHTMIAGASSIGMALLVVAADDGVMPQTREHLQILLLLGVTRGVVALTKTDLVDANRVFEVELEIANLTDWAVFPVSCATGAGIDSLRFRLNAEAGTVATHDDGYAFRLAVDRSFSLAGAGTVVTGSVVSGSVRVGDTVAVLPGDFRARVRGIHAANHTVARAGTGERCALNLAGPGVRKDAVGRGDWVIDPALAARSRRCDVTLRLLNTERSALKHWTPVLVHHGAGVVAARVVLLEPQVLPPGETGLAQLVLHRDIPIRHGDRLVLRDIGGIRTIAGGTALDPLAPERHRRRDARLAVLRALAAGDGPTGMLRQPPFLLRRDAMLASFGYGTSGAIALGVYVALPDKVASLTEDATDALASFHARRPFDPGMTAEALRLALPHRLSRDAFAALVASIVATGAVAAEAHLLRLAGHRGGLAGEEARIWELLRPILEAERFRPALLRETAAATGIAEVPLRRACKGFARSGLVIEVAPDRFFIRDAVIAMADATHALVTEVAEVGFSVAQFRDRIGCGRQLGIQVLEYFDRRGITVRRGDLRRGGKAVGAVFGG